MIREATPSDVPVIHRLVRDLAAYERAADEAIADEDQLADALFGPHPAVFAHLAVDDESGEPVGFALWFRNFSTWLGRHGVYLEDLYVLPSARGHGHGRALLVELARICVDRGYGRLEWSVLNWNEPSIGFYRSLGATPVDGWTVYRLTDDALRSLAASDEPRSRLASYGDSAHTDGTTAQSPDRPRTARSADDFAERTR